MQVLAYTHSGDSVSVLYGFACLFVLGFLWAALGGAGAALPACLDRERLTALFAPMTAVFVAWAFEELWLEPWLRSRGYRLNWFDTDWPGALMALIVALAWAAGPSADRRGDVAHPPPGRRLVGRVPGAGRRPRVPDDAAEGRQLVGMPRDVRGADGVLLAEEAGRRRAGELRHGLLGGIGFAGAVMLKLVEVTSGLQTNWHSLYEQTAGLFHGVALAAAMAILARRAPARG